MPNKTTISKPKSETSGKHRRNAAHFLSSYPGKPIIKGDINKNCFSFLTVWQGIYGPDVRWSAISGGAHCDH